MFKINLKKLVIFSAHPSLIEYITSNYYDRVMKIVIKDGMFIFHIRVGFLQIII